jgi:hypothetical protein
MATCASCRTVILFGGVKDEGRRYCSDECLAHARNQAMAATIPPETLEKRVSEIHSGRCPACGGPGPVDAYHSVRYWSFFAIHGWVRSLTIGCRSCGTRRIWRDIGLTILAGWWSPWGWLFTPAHLIANVLHLLQRPSPVRPSRLLTQRVEAAMAAALREASDPASPMSGGGPSVPEGLRDLYYD